MKNTWSMSVLILVITTLTIVGANSLGTHGNINEQRSPASLQCRKMQIGCSKNEQCCSKKCISGVCSKRAVSGNYNGQNCAGNKDCLSKNCSNLKICAPSKTVKSGVGEFCLGHRGCKSNICDARSRACRGPSSIEH